MIIEIYSFVEKSDHKAVVLVLKFQREKWGNSYWKFNESLLENENYIKLIEHFWKGWQSEKLKYSSIIFSNINFKLLLVAMLPLLVSRSEIMQLKSPNTIYLSVLLLILLQYSFL
jgi:hypothetical protein